MVNCPSAGIEQWFICDKWLAVDEGDGLIERTLYESVGMRKKRQKCMMSLLTQDFCFSLVFKISFAVLSKMIMMMMMMMMNLLSVNKIIKVLNMIST